MDQRAARESETAESIGTSESALSESAELRSLAVGESTTVLVDSPVFWNASGIRARAGETYRFCGELTTFANDVPGYYGNNRGFVVLTITRSE